LVFEKRRTLHEGVSKLLRYKVDFVVKEDRSSVGRSGLYLKECLGSDYERIKVGFFFENAPDTRHFF
jgi:hypothetical protein